MKITLDHNCLISLEKGQDTANAIRIALTNPEYHPFIVNVGASEMQRFGIRPDNYAAFEEFLNRLGINNLPRLDPIAVWDVTFFDRCLWAGDKDVELLTQIQSVLFGTTTKEQPAHEAGIFSRKRLNQLCDALTMWCHISYCNDVFVTADRNFFKKTKKPQLEAMGAGRICSPDQL